MAKANAYTLLLVRCGSTAWDLEGRVTGSVDLPLCEEGRAQLKQDLACLDKAKLKVVLTAPDEASVETAKALAKRTGAKVKPIDDLANIDLGLWEGLLAADLEERQPTNFKRWLDDPSTVAAPEGEDLAEAESRILLALAKSLDKLKEEHPAVGVVLKPLSLGILRARLLKASPAQVGDLTRTAPPLAWHELDRNGLRNMRQPAKVPAAPGAA